MLDNKEYEAIKYFLKNKKIDNLRILNNSNLIDLNNLINNNVNEIYYNNLIKNYLRSYYVLREYLLNYEINYYQNDNYTFNYYLDYKDNLINFILDNIIYQYYNDFNITINNKSLCIINKNSKEYKKFKENENKEINLLYDNFIYENENYLILFNIYENENYIKYNILDNEFILKIN